MCPQHNPVLSHLTHMGLDATVAEAPCKGLSLLHTGVEVRLLQRYLEVELAGGLDFER